jgi:hypothetical protein
VRPRPPFIAEWREAPSFRWVRLGPLTGLESHCFVMSGLLHSVNGVLRDILCALLAHDVPSMRHVGPLNRG